MTGSIADDSPTDRRAAAPLAFTEVQLLVLMVVVWLAVEMAIQAPRLLCGALVLLALTLRSRLMFVVAVVALASGLSHASEQAYQLAERETLEGEPATIVLDAEPARFGWRAEARIDRTGQRVRLVGSGFATPGLVAGDGVDIDGRLVPIEPTRWSKSRHLVGVVTVAAINATSGPAWYLKPGEWLRAGVFASTTSFEPDHRSLYHGLVIGDDRLQSEGQRAQFRAAGLSHLLAVSGQNVAFLLAVSGPLLRRLRPSAEIVAIAALLTTFALATRLEPSVLRATATAGISVLAISRSSRSAGVRSLSLAVILLLCVDPFLAGSVGFRLSVGASLGILLLAPPIRDRLAGPDLIAAPLAITLAAQLGVSPLLMAEFGPVSVVTIPANLLAGWAAGLVMTLGLSVGLVAAVVPETVATLLQAPSRWLVGWVAGVAAVGARTPLPSIGPSSLPLAFLGALTLWWWGPKRPLGRLVLGVIALWVMVTISAPRAAVPGWHARTSRTLSVLVVEGTGPSADELIAARVNVIDIVIVPDGGWSTAQMVARLREVADIGLVLAPSDHRIVGGRRVLDDTTIEVGGGLLIVRSRPSNLEVEFVVGGQATG